MPWVRIHDGAMSHPKILALSNGAFRLWVHGLAYCQLHLTDGLIPKTAIRQMGGTPSRVAELTKSIDSEYDPLWECHEIGYKVHDFLCWNASRADIQEKRAIVAKRQEIWRKHRSERRVTRRVTERVTNAVRNGVHSTPLQGNTKTIPPLPPPGGSPPSASERGFDRFWLSYPRKVGKGAARKVWAKIKPDAALEGLIEASVRAQEASSQWRRDGGRFIPHPATWLNQGRWEDAVEEAPAGLGGPRRWSPEDCRHEPHCGSASRCEVTTTLEAARAARSRSPPTDHSGA